MNYSDNQKQYFHILNIYKLHILYRNKDNKSRTINQQIFDVGALGYGRQGTTQLTPILKYFQIVKPCDTTKIDKTQWIYVNEEGDIHSPSDGKQQAIVFFFKSG